MSHDHSSLRSSFNIFAVGALIGAGIALLYAPQSSKKTRKLLAKRLKVLRNGAQDTVEYAQELIKDGKAHLAAAGSKSR